MPAIVHHHDENMYDGGDDCKSSTPRSSDYCCKKCDNNTCDFYCYHHGDDIALEAAHLLEIETLENKNITKQLLESFGLSLENVGTPCSIIGTNVVPPNNPRVLKTGTKNRY